MKRYQCVRNVGSIWTQTLATIIIITVIIIKCLCSVYQANVFMLKHPNVHQAQWTISIRAFDIVQLTEPQPAAVCISESVLIKKLCSTFLLIRIVRQRIFWPSSTCSVATFVDLRKNATALLTENARDVLRLVFALWSCNAATDDRENLPCLIMSIRGSCRKAIAVQQTSMLSRSETAAASIRGSQARVKNYMLTVSSYPQGP